MLVVELNLDDNLALTDRATGRRLADIRLASLIQYPTHTAIRLGVEAPQSVSITRPEKHNGLRKPSNGRQSQQ